MSSLQKSREMLVSTSSHGGPSALPLTKRCKYSLPGILQVYDRRSIVAHSSGEREVLHKKVTLVINDDVAFEFQKAS